MGVNTMTLQRNEEMTKHTYSSDGECKLSVTLIDVSSDDNPADKTKSCSVTVTPVRPDNSIDLTSTVSGDCGTVAFDAALAFGDSLPSGGSWSQNNDKTEPEPSRPTGPPPGGFTGQIFGGCDFDTKVDHPHMSSTRIHVSVHGWWVANEEDCPSHAWVTVWLKAYYCVNPRLNLCNWYTVGHGRSTVPSYRNSSHRVNARSHCGPATSPVGYRGIVDVDLIGQIDWPDRKHSDFVNFYCNPH